MFYFCTYPCYWYDGYLYYDNKYIWLCKMDFCTFWHTNYCCYFCRNIHKCAEKEYANTCTQYWISILTSLLKLLFFDIHVLSNSIISVRIIYNMHQLLYILAITSYPSSNKIKYSSNRLYIIKNV